MYARLESPSMSLTGEFLSSFMRSDEPAIPKEVLPDPVPGDSRVDSPDGFGQIACFDRACAGGGRLHGLGGGTEDDLAPCLI